MTSGLVKHCDACGAYIGYSRERIHEHPCSAYRTEPSLRDSQTFDRSIAVMRNTEDGLTRYRRGLR